MTDGVGRAFPLRGPLPFSGANAALGYLPLQLALRAEGRKLKICPGKGRFARTFYLFSAKVSGMPGICYTSRSAEVCQESIKTWQRVVPVVGGCPASELRQHLSELVPTDVGDHINIHVNVITNDTVKRIWLHQLFKFLIWYQENVLTHPKLLCWFVLYRGNVLDGTKSQCRTMLG